MAVVCTEFRNWAARLCPKRRLLLRIAAALVFLVAIAGFGGLTAVSAEDAPYTEASLTGDYAFVGHYSGDVASLVGTAEFDGKGDLTSGSARVVIVGGAVKAITYNGQYTMNPDGTGKMALTVYGVGTPAPMVTLDFVITKARVVDGIKVATEIEDALEGPSVVVPGQNSFVTHVFTRRPDRERRRR